MFFEQYFYHLDFHIIAYNINLGWSTGGPRNASRKYFFLLFSHCLDERNGKKPKEQDIFKFLYIWDSLIFKLLLILTHCTTTTLSSSKTDPNFCVQQNSQVLVYNCLYDKRFQSAAMYIV